MSNKSLQPKQIVQRSLFALFLFISIHSNAQKQQADSVLRLLNAETIDSNRVTHLWRMADYTGIYNPDTAIHLAQQALDLARRIEYLEGESRSIGILANTFMRIGNYPRALEYNLQKLKIEEKRTNYRSLSSVLMNIGIVHVLQDEYRKALEYYFKADTVIRLHDVKDFKFNIALNIGDAYDRLNILDSAYKFYNASLAEAKSLQNDDLIGVSLTGLGHIYRKQGNYLLSLDSYKSAISFLQLANDDDQLCEANLGLAMLYQHLINYDSAVAHANIAYQTGKKDGFLSRQLDAAKFLTQVYKDKKNIDSAFTYANFERELNDSVNSKNKIRESQILSSNEQIRQVELAEAKRVEEKERKKRMQLLFIGMFIPALFLLTLLTSRIKLHIRAIKLLGILSLLFFFEYLTLLLHPTVAGITNHTPILEILIFVGIAAILIPMHHRAEHWLIHKLLYRHLNVEEKNKAAASEELK